MMEDSGTEIAAQNHHVLAAVHHLVKALEAAAKNLDPEMQRVLTDLDLHLSKLTVADGKHEADQTKEIENRLKFAHKKILSFQSKEYYSRIWNSGPGEDYGYLQAVDEVRKLAIALESAPSTRRGKELAEEAQSILQKAMAKLQEELVQILSKNMHQIEHQNQNVVFLPSLFEEAELDEQSIVSNEDESFEVVPKQRNHYDQHHLVDLVHPNTIPLIKGIAELMISSHYDQEFRQAFTAFWKNSLDDYLITVNVKQLSIEDVLKMDWKCLNCRIKNWCRATKSLMGFYLPSLRRLFNKILEGFDQVNSSTFIEVSKGSVICLLNFGHAVTIGPRTPERLFCLLDMYEVLSGFQQDVNDLFPQENGRLVRTEFHELLDRLGASAKGIFLQFGAHIASNASTMPFSSGGITHLTRYVMNYIMLVQEYGHTLNFLLEDEEARNPCSNVDRASQSPVAHYLQYITSVLEANLDAKSDLYRDKALKHIFMMNNIHYMVRKIENSEIRAYFGNEWLKRHVSKFRQHATSYERISWGNIHSVLKDDGCKGKNALKDKCRKFNAAFEELYKSQTGWKIPDMGLKEDVRISASGRLINAYRPFVGRLRDGNISDKHFKYSEEDLGNYIWDLFEENPKPLNHQRRQ